MAKARRAAQCGAAQTPDKRNAKAYAEILARLPNIEVRIREVSETLAAEFPDYAALASPQPLSVEEVQSLLGQDEAVVLFLDTLFIDILGAKRGPAETFIWVVTKTDVRWVRSDLDILALIDEIGALRCGLDAAIRTNARCAELAAKSGRKHQPPFDLVRAHAVYKAIFGKVEDLIKGKQMAPRIVRHHNSASQASWKPRNLGSLGESLIEAERQGLSRIFSTH
jgi:hypothetical protein